MQQAHLNDATPSATTTQQSTSKPASLLDLARNKLRNNHATSSEKVVQQAHSKQGVVVARSELTRLVGFCAEINGFTEEEHADALECALADFDSAMIFFRSYEQETLSSPVAITHLKHEGEADPLTIVIESSHSKHERAA